MNARAPGAIQSPAVSADQRHQEVEMAALMNPAVFSGNELRSSETIGNKGLNALLGLRRYRGQSNAPSLIAFFSLKQNGVEKESSMMLNRLHCHNIHNPVHPFELEVETIAKERVWAGRKTQTRLEFRIGTDSF